MGLTRSSEILKIDLGFNRDNFIVAKIVHSLSRFREITFVFFDLIIVVGERDRHLAFFELKLDDQI